MEILLTSLSRQYTIIPPLRRDDNVIPYASEIPALLTSLRHPRKRAVSIGPQSAADAYETLAYRHKRRRESMSSPTAIDLPRSLNWNGSQGQEDCLTPGSPRRQKSASESQASNLLTPISSRLQSYEQMMGTGKALPAPDASPASNTCATTSEAESSAETRKREEKEKGELFSNVEKPRVRYDVEVIMKLIVYTGRFNARSKVVSYTQVDENTFSGIAWLAVEGNPILFELCGLGTGTP